MTQNFFVKISGVQKKWKICRCWLCWYLHIHFFLKIFRKKALWGNLTISYLSYFNYLPFKKNKEKSCFQIFNELYIHNTTLNPSLSMGQSTTWKDAALFEFRSNEVIPSENRKLHEKQGHGWVNELINSFDDDRGIRVCWPMYHCFNRRFWHALKALYVRVRAYCTFKCFKKIDFVKPNNHYHTKSYANLLQYNIKSIQ